MGMLDKVTDFVGGSLFKEIREGIMAYFPPKMTEQEKLQFEINISRVLAEKQRQADGALAEASQQLDKRIEAQEGTAKDLKTIPVLGHLILFARGAQRPIWGYATLWMDAKWLFGTFAFTDRQEVAMIVINLLVLGFLFGERTVLNLQPLIMAVFGKKSSDVGGKKLNG